MNTAKDAIMGEKKLINLDQDQEAAYLADQNAAVSAGAGSGKTTVLAERYVRLVTQGGLNISEVLTLTFTRKAATEMYARIFQSLGSSPDPRAQERLTQFDQARIATLDSFCTAITRGGSYRYGISGDFRIDEAELVRTAVETAIEIIMRHRQDEAVCRLVAAHTFEAVVKKLFADAAMKVFSFIKPGNFRDQGKKQIDFIKSETEICGQKITELCHAILAIDASKSKSDLLQKAQAAIRSQLPLPMGFEPAQINGLIEIAEFLKSPDSFRKPGAGKAPGLIAFQEAAALLKEKRCPQLLSLAQTLLFQEDILSIGKILDEYERLFLERKRIKGLISFRDTAELAVDILTNDLELRTYYKQHIKAIMIDEFQDNNKLQKNLLYLLAERDDTGTAGNIPAAEALAPDKLFFVGDEKQSIYRFRGADVSVFRGLAQELGKERQASLCLSTNYRSAPELVDFFNALFPGVFGIPQAPFEAEFSPMRPGPNKVRQGPEVPPAVEVFIQETQRDRGCEDNDETIETSKEIGEALATAQRIVKGVSAGEFGFGKVAVLFRSTTHQNEYERVFREAGIPFSAADPRGLFAEGPANDFYAVLRLSLFPLDRNAYATALRSPFVKLGDESVFKIMLERPDEPFTSAPQDSWFSSPSERERYKQGENIIRELKNRIDVQKIAPIVAYLWYETGYRTYLLYDEPSQSNIEHFEYLYALALKADQRRLTMGAFLDELAPRIGTTDKTETEDIPELKDKVLFITVHKSKGLEFPVVILANAGASSRGDTNDKLYFLDPVYGPVINLKSDTAKRKDPRINYFYSIQQELANQQTEAELKRLFYVAATRAKERLILIGSRDVTKKENERLLYFDPKERVKALVEEEHRNSKGKVYKKSFLDLFSLGLKEAPQAVQLYQLFPLEPLNIQEYRGELQNLRRQTRSLTEKRLSGESQVSLEAFYKIPPCQAAASKIIHTSPSQLENYYASLHPRTAGAVQLPFLESDSIFDVFDTPAAEPIKEEESPEGTILTSEELRRRFGTLCHQVIEKLLVGNVLKEALRETAYQEAYNLFHRAELSESALKTITTEALELAQRFLESPQGQEAAGSPRRQAEFPFILPLQKTKTEDSLNKTVLIRGAMDLIYEYQGQCVIVDFKTDRYLNPESHIVQLSCYRSAAKAFSDLPVKTALVYLRNMESKLVESALSDSELFDLAKDLQDLNQAKGND
ncbi:MAG: UvrD-helicase domain-containing protein [Treponema sp.]|jgi:ATP-dependent helicase/nuclease subunit A|nr:UvrD-helicase domain-containing protein [Treponema sp.]